MLKYGARATRLRGNPLDLMPALTRIARVIDSTAGRRDHMIGVARIDVDGKDVRIVDDAILYDPPAAAAISALIRKIPGSGVDGICVAGIDCQRFYVHKAGRAGRGQRSPCFSRILRLEDAVEGSRYQNVWISF